MKTYTIEEIASPIRSYKQAIIKTFEGGKEIEEIIFHGNFYKLILIINHTYN